MSLFVEYVRDVLRHWVTLISGGSLVTLYQVAISLAPSERNWPMPLWLKLALILGAAAIAQFLAWRDKRRDADDLRSEVLTDFADSLMLDKYLSPLSDRQKVDEAAAQLQRILARYRRRRTTEHRQQLASTSKRYLATARGCYGSADPYSTLFDEVQKELRSAEPGLNF